MIVITTRQRFRLTLGSLKLSTACAILVACLVGTAPTVGHCQSAEEQVGKIVDRARKSGELLPEDAKTLVDLMIANPNDVAVVVHAGRGLKVAPEVARPEVVRLVESFDRFETTDRYVMETIGLAGAAPDEAIPLLTEKMKAASTVTANKAVIALAGMLSLHDRDLDPTLEVIRERIKSSSFGDTDIYSLSEAIGGKTAALIPEIEPLLKKTLQSKYPSASLMRACVNMGPAAEPLAPHLIAALSELPDNGFKFACEAVAKIGKHEDAFVEALPTLLEDANKSHRTLETLAEFPAAASKASHLIDEMLTESPADNSEGVILVMGACGEVGRKKYTKLLKEIADGGDYEGRVAAQSLLRLYPDRPAGVEYCLTKIGGYSNLEKRNLWRWLGDDLATVVKHAEASKNPRVQQWGRELAEPPPPELEY